MTFSVRPATLEDIDVISNIEKEVHASPWAESHFVSELEKPYSHFILMSDDETDKIIVGYIVAWILNDHCEILNLAISFKYQRKGFGKKLIHKVISLAIRKEIKKIYLNVRKSNQSAIQFYHEVGFIIHHVRKNFYSNNEDAYEMVLKNDLDQFFNDSF